MGLFSFAAEAGKKILGIQTHDQPAQQLGPDQLNAIQQHVDGLGLNIQNLGVQFSGPGSITLTGDTTSKADAEKAALMAGNIMGITSVSNNISVGAGESEQEPDSDTYTVDKGDNLSKIAKMYYGDANKYPAIVEANQPMINDADEIYPGQVLRIPKEA